MSGYDDSYAKQNSPEGRAAIEQARAENAAKATEALRREVSRYAPQLLPQAVDRIVEKEGQRLGGGDPARLSAKVFEWMNSAAADRYRKPETAPVRERPAVDFGLGVAPVARHASTPKPAEPKADALRQALALFAGDFKTPALLERFYEEHALTWAWAEPAKAVEFVAGAMADRRFKAFQKREAEPSAATLRLVEALKPFDALLKDPLLDVAEGDRFSDLVGLNAPTSVKHLTQLVEARLKGPSCAPLLVDGTFDPSKVARPRPAVQASPERPAAEPTWEERNRAHFARVGL